MALNKIKTSSLDDDSVTSAKLANGAVTANDINDGELPLAKISQVNLDIAPEVLEIQVAAPAAGQDTAWLWTWLTSSLPYARREITNSPEIQVPLYRQGTYTVNNYAAYDLFDQMTQTHSLYLKWIDGAGTDNLVSWATSTGPVSDTHPDINSGNATDVQRINISVPATITLPTLTAPNVSYTVVNNGAGAYTFSGAAKGDNPNIGPFYRGGTYTFNITATGHPLYLTTDNGTNFASGTYFGEYTDGVTGSRTDSGTLTIVVPNDAPDTLYYQCGNHGVMRGAITVKDLAVETNINGNPVVYFQHTQEGHKTPVEIRPIPALVNQMCLVYDAGTGKFVPQDLATYVENTPSFENKIREVAGTAELVVEDGSAVVAKVNVYQDSTYLPLVGNNAGDQAFATDNNKLYIWDGSAWQLAGAANTGELPEGTNLYYTDARVGSYLSSNGYDTATNIVASITDSAPATLDTLNELAAALGDDPNFATTTANNIAGKVAKTGDTMTGELDVDAQIKTNLLRLSKNGDPTSIGATIGLSNAGGDANSNDITITAANSTNNIVLRSAINIDAQTYQSGSWNSRLKILQNGNVGIGTTNPQYDVDIHVADNDGVSIVGSADTNSGWRIKPAGNDLHIGQNTIADRITLQDGGHFGINNTNPAYQLHVQDNTTWNTAAFASTHTTGAGLTFLTNGSGGSDWSLIANSSGGGAGQHNLGFHMTNNQSGGTTGYKMSLNPNGSLQLSNGGTPQINGNLNNARAFTIMGEGTGNSGASVIKMTGRDNNQGAGFVQTEVYGLTNITNQVEISRITGTGANGFRMLVEVTVCGHTGSLGNAHSIKKAYWDGGSNSVYVISEEQSDTNAITVNINTPSTNVLRVNLSSANSTNGFNGVAEIKYYVPIDFAGNTWTTS